MKMAHSEKQVVELTRALESLMREKKELEVKERIMRDSLNGITEHMDHLFAHKAGPKVSCTLRYFYSLTVVRTHQHVPPKRGEKNRCQHAIAGCRKQDFEVASFQHFVC